MYRERLRSQLKTLTASIHGWLRNTIAVILVWKNVCMWMEHKGLHSSSLGFVFVPTSSLNKESLKKLCPLLPTHTHTHTNAHTHQSVRAAFPKYYSNPLTSACVSCVTGGWGDKRVFVFCARAAASSHKPLHLRMCAYLSRMHERVCVCVCVCVCLCAWATYLLLKHFCLGCRCHFSSRSGFFSSTSLGV